MGERICIMPDCNFWQYGHGLCSKHYQRWRRHGDPNVDNFPQRKMTASERFWMKVDVGDCWDWTAGRTRNGYGVFHNGERDVSAHRWAYESLVGPIPDGLQLDHLCRNRCCVNPDHLEPVTPRENNMRGVTVTSVNAAKSECDNGHPFDAANTYMRPEGGRGVPEMPYRPNYCVETPQTGGQHLMADKRLIARGRRSAFAAGPYLPERKVLLMEGVRLYAGRRYWVETSTAPAGAVYSIRVGHFVDPGFLYVPDEDGPINVSLSITGAAPTAPVEVLVFEEAP